MIVDDSESDVRLLQTLFARMEDKYQITWTHSYDQALQLIEQRAFDVLMFDYRLDKRTGLDLMQEPAVIESEVPVIFITAHNDEEVDLAALRAGAADYISKMQLSDRRSLERTLRYVMERSATLRRLRHSENRYRAVVDDQPDMIIRFDEDGEITFVNQAYETFRGLSYSKLIGTPYTQRIHRRDQPALEAFVRRLGPDERMTSVEVRAEGNQDDALPFWLHWTTTRIEDEKGELIEYQSVIRDISEEKLVEQELNARIEQLRTLRRVDAELTETLDIGAVISLALDSAMRLSGAGIAVMAFTKENTGELDVARAYGMMDTDAIAPIYRQKRGVIGEVARHKSPVLIDDVSDDPSATPTDPKTVAQMVIPLMSQERFLGLMSLETRRKGRFTKEVLEFIQLVTARIAVSIENARLYDLRKQQLEELQKLYEQVSQLEQIKTDMIRIASHDLRNPLGVVQSYIDMMNFDISSGEVEISEFTDHLTRMEGAVSRMRKITTDILTLERFNRDGGEPSEQVDLAFLIREVAAEQLFSADQKNQEYVVDVSDQSTFVMGDWVQLQEAVVNLIGNAIKYTPAGGTITIMLEDDGDAAIFEVKDSGYGIPKAQQGRLFQPFYRAKTQETNQIEGTGLGLHLVKNIIDRHGGRMIFHSVYQKGSTFGFQLPTHIPE